MRRMAAGAPTRMNLQRLRRRLERVAKGVDLLKRKREALVLELFRAARPAVDARAAIAGAAREAYAALLQALAVQGRAGLAAIAWPERALALDVRPSSVYGVPTARVAGRPAVRRTLEARGTAPGPTGPAAAVTATEFERLLDLLLEAAPGELLLRRLGEALARTSRQVNTLERRVMPALGAGIGAIRRTLDEREREERVRLARLLAGRGAR